MCKKLFFISFLSLLIFSQNDLKSQEVHFGFKAGINHATLFGDDDKYNDPVFDFHGGLYTEISLMKKFALQGELLYSRQGTDIDNEGRITLSYISIPMLAKLKFIRGKLGFYGGPQVSYLLNADYDFDGFDGDAKDFYKDFDISLALGADFNLTKYLSVGGRYLFSIPSIGDDYKDDFITIDAPEVRNGVIQVYLGFVFHKKK
ncbi:MAG: hypothetical protein CMP59_03835 [Flavobacteriales bacterium]|nr:hypothetical protein [Flavobacteriales bacterium]